MPTRTKYTNELNDLVDQVRLMSTRLEDTLDKVIENLKDKNEILAKTIVKNDDEFDRAEHDIEEKCLKLTLTQQPVATDWREIAGILKMVSDLERIADHCADISKYTAALADKESVEIPDYFKDMVNVMRDMVRDAISCFDKFDAELAEKVMRTDDVIDSYFARFRTDIESSIETNPKAAEQYVDYLMIAKYVERIADHSTNIAEWVLFIVKNELK